MAVDTKDFMGGRMYYHHLEYSTPPKFGKLIERARTQEIDEPFRFGIGIAIRMPFTKKAVVVGKWVHMAPDEGTALTYAVMGRVVKDDELEWDTVRYGAQSVEKEEQAGTRTD
jgi:hypothetical protein